MWQGTKTCVTVFIKLGVMRTAAMLPFPACHSQSFVLFACYTQSWLSAIILTVSLFSCVFLFFAGRWHSRHRRLSVWTLQRCGNPVEERSQRSRPAECEPPLQPLLWPLLDQRPLNVSMSVCQEHDGWLHAVPQQLESSLSGFFFFFLQTAESDTTDIWQD